jgi:hypothetical protein
VAVAVAVATQAKQAVLVGLAGVEQVPLVAPREHQEPLIVAAVAVAVVRAALAVQA